MCPPLPPSTLFPYTTLFRSESVCTIMRFLSANDVSAVRTSGTSASVATASAASSVQPPANTRSEEHTSELQSPCISYAVFCLKKKNINISQNQKINKYNSC